MLLNRYFLFTTSACHMTRTSDKKTYSYKGNCRICGKTASSILLDLLTFFWASLWNKTLEFKFDLRFRCSQVIFGTNFGKVGLGFIGWFKSTVLTAFAIGNSCKNDWHKVFLFPFFSWRLSAGKAGFFTVSPISEITEGLKSTLFNVPLVFLVEGCRRHSTPLSIFNALLAASFLSKFCSLETWFICSKQSISLGSCNFFSLSFLSRL